MTEQVYQFRAGKPVGEREEGHCVTQDASAEARPRPERRLVWCRRCTLETRVGTRRLLPVLAVVVVAIFASASMVLPATAATSEGQRLRDAQESLQKIKNQVEAAQAQKAEDAAALQKAEAQLDEVAAALDDAEIALQTQQQAVARARNRLADLKQEQERRRGAVVERAVRLYKQGVDIPLARLFATGSLAKMADRSAHLSAATHADQEAMERTAAGEVAVDAQQQQLEEEERVLARVARQRRRMQAAAKELQATRALKLAKTRTRIADLREQERLAEADTRKLAAAVERSERQAARRTAMDSGAAANRRVQAQSPSRGRSAASGPNSSAGGWLWPARGPATSEFGPRWGRMHEGIDIGAGSGSPIYAASDGVVSFAGVMGGYGNMTLIDHGGTVTAYAHQSRIGVGVGQSVRAGQVIGSVGSTGNVTGPHLHFEVRAGGEPRNPRGYLP